MQVMRYVMCAAILASLAGCSDGNSNAPQSAGAASAVPDAARADVAAADNPHTDIARPDATHADETQVAANPATAESTTTEDAQTRAVIESFPAIPVIVIPEIIGVSPAQRTLESSMQDIIDPMAGIRVSPARCDSGDVLLPSAGLTSIDAQGNLLRNGEEGIFDIRADGSGTANFEGGLISVNADGSGTINGDGDGDDAIIRVEADGAGTYNGPAGLISLDGKGAGTWNGPGGLISNNGDGSGTWNGPQGLVTVNRDGSGTWNGPLGLVENNGDGTGQIGTPPRQVDMPPLPQVQPAGRFPLLKTFAMPGAPCGYVITLDDRVLFDFDKSDIRADADDLLDTLSVALKQVKATGMEIRGHTDSKGSDDYNQRLSEQRATAVVTALQTRGAAPQAQSRGYGESQPVAPNSINGQDNPGGRQLNRRVEIFVRT